MHGTLICAPHPDRNLVRACHSPHGSCSQPPLDLTKKYDIRTNFFFQDLVHPCALRCGWAGLFLRSDSWDHGERHVRHSVGP